MIIEKIFSEQDSDEKLYSIVLTDEEVALFSEVQERYFANVMVNRNKEMRGQRAALKEQKQAKSNATLADKTPAERAVLGIKPDPYYALAGKQNVKVTEMPNTPSLSDRISSYFNRGKAAASGAMDKIGNTFKSISGKLSSGFGKLGQMASNAADAFVNHGRDYNPAGDGVFAAASAAGNYGGKRTAPQLGVTRTGMEGLSSGRMGGATGTGIRRGMFQGRFSEVDYEDENQDEYEY